jgi:hypothetical protein
LANDSTAPDGGETLTVTGFTPASHGTVQVTGGGSGVAYTPGPGFLGSDAFTYTVSDGNGGSATATVNISAPRNQAPTADDDTAAAVEDGGPVFIDVLNGDTDPDGDPLSIALVGAAAHGSVAVVGGQVRYTPNEFYFGPDAFQYFVSDGHGGLDAGTATVTVAPRHGFYATGTDAGPAGSVSTVRLYHAGSGKLLLSFAPYPGFAGGVRVAVGDVTGDGVPDVVTAPGKGLAGGSRIKVFDGAALLNNTVTEVGPGVLPFGVTYTEELSLALGRFNGDAQADILVGSFTILGGPDAVVLDGAQALTGAASPVGTVTDPFGPLYKGGVRVAAGDVNGDGVLDVIAAQSFNGAKVTAFSGSDFRTVLTTFATALTLKGGVYVSAGDLDGDGKAEIVTGAGSGVAVVAVWRDRSALDTKAIKVASARPFGSLFAGGARVAVADLDGDGRLDVAVAPGVGKERRLMLLGLNGPALDPLDELRTAEGPFYAGGLFVAAGRV